MSGILSGIGFLLVLTTACTPSDSESPPSLTPNPRMLTHEWMSLSQWYHFHAEDVALATEGEAPLIFMGDSITQGWNGEGQVYWEQHFAPLGAVNFGIGGDMTQNLLWRLKHGATEKLDPQAIMLLIGTNNLSFTQDEPDTIAAGVTAVVDALGQSYPNADILLMGVFPRKQLPDHPIREKVSHINRLISELEVRPQVSYMDITEQLLEPDGSISEAVMPDFLHLSAEGYRRWAEAVLPWISARLGRE